MHRITTLTAYFCTLPAITRLAETMPFTTLTASLCPLPATTHLAETMHRITEAQAFICTIPATTRYTTTFSTTLTTFIFTTQILTPGTPPGNQALTSSEAHTWAATSGLIRTAQASAKSAR